MKETIRAVKQFKHLYNNFLIELNWTFSCRFMHFEQFASK